MTLVWPPSLPQDVLQGYTRALGDSRLRTKMAAGAAKVRNLYSGRVRLFRLEIELDRDFVTVFEQFWDTDTQGGVLPFEWLDPLTQQTVTFRFGDMGQDGPVPKHYAGRLYRIPLVLEVLP